MKKTYGTMYYVNEMSASVTFYKRSLGINPTFESSDWTEFDLSGHKLCLHSKKADQEFPTNGILILEVDGIKALYQNMLGDGHKVFGLHEIHPAAWSFHFKDINDNELSFYGKP